MSVKDRKILPEPDLSNTGHHQNFLRKAFKMTCGYISLSVEKEDHPNLSVGDLKHPVTFGIDQYGRKFFAFVIEVEEKNGVWEKTDYVIFNQSIDHPESWKGSGGKDSLLIPKPSLSVEEVKLLTVIIDGWEGAAVHKEIDNISKEKWDGCRVRLWSPERDLVRWSNSLPRLEIERVGPTGYHDGLTPEDLVQALMGGTDSFNRPFISFKGYVIGVPLEKGSVSETIFQRFIDKDSLWMSCSCGTALNLLCSSGGISSDQIDFYKTLFEKTSAVIKPEHRPYRSDWVGKTFVLGI